MARSTRSCLVIYLALVLGILLPMVPCFGQSGGTAVGSDINYDTVWTSQGSPYHVNSLVTVKANASLKIESGVTVKFDHGAGLVVKGSMVATNVVFTSASGSPNPGDWPGLSFQDANQGQTILSEIKVMYASTDLEVQGTRVALGLAQITKFSMNGVSVSNGGTLNITNSNIQANQGDGSECMGTLEAYQDTVIANNAVMAESSCQGTIDRSVLTANTYRGVDAASDTTLVVKNSLINSTSPSNSYGVFAETGSKIVLKGDDIVGHAYCIYTVTASITVQGVSVRNYIENGIFSEAPITIKGSFAGGPNPVGKEKPPAAGNDKVTFDSPLASPFDIDTIVQPPSVIITSPAEGATFNGKVTFTGQAWEPDKTGVLTKVEIRITNYEDNEILPWTSCTGTGSWTYTWKSKDSSIVDYKVYVRATTGDGQVVQPQYMTIESDPYGSGYNPFSSLLTIYTQMCYAFLIIITIVAIIAVYYFMFYRKKRDAKAAALQPAYQQPYPAYQAQYQYSPAPQTTPTAPAPDQEEYILEDVFLVYKDGRLIHHDTRRLRPEVDDQTLGGMFTAIQDFIGQSFPAEDGTKGQIKEITYEDNKILLEHGKYVYLAVVVGSLKDTKGVHKRMSKLLKAIEDECAVNLIGWDGNLESLAKAKRMVKMMYTDEDIDNYVD